MHTFISKVVLSGLFVLLYSGSALADQRPPNVVIVITDDQGYGDLSCLGNPTLKTPNLDQLHQQSLRFTDYHVAPTCSPTRSAIQTGRYPNRVGVWHTVSDRCMLWEEETTIGQMFNDAGYATGMFGKWHLGDCYPYRPEDRGYQEVLRHGGGGVGQTPDYWDNAYFNDTYFRNGEPEKQNGYCTDVFFDAAMNFIRTQSANKKPFLAYIATNAPHSPFHAPEKFSQPFNDLEVGLANFLGMISNIDHNVGRLRSELEKLGIGEDTIFIFTTDNGTAMGHKVFPANMRGHKGSEYDGGHRVPLFVHWPAGKMIGGRDIKPIAAHVDLAPTLLDLCNIPQSPDADFDGVSLKPLLEGTVDQWPDRVLITDSQRIPHPKKWRKSAVMTSRWRLVNQSELFDMRDDPLQTTNVAAKHEEVVKRLQTAYDQWWSGIQPSLKRRNHIHIGRKQGEWVSLNCHDWTTAGGIPWNQAAIRNAANNNKNIGSWSIRVLQSGTYNVALRRWPKESNTAIDAGLPPGDPVPGVQAIRARPGLKISPASVMLEIGDVKKEMEFTAGAQEIEFTVELKEGDTELTGTFLTSKGESFNAYYAYVSLEDPN